MIIGKIPCLSDPWVGGGICSGVVKFIFPIQERILTEIEKFCEHIHFITESFFAFELYNVPDVNCFFFLNCISHLKVSVLFRLWDASVRMFKWFFHKLFHWVFPCFQFHNSLEVDPPSYKCTHVNVSHCCVITMFIRVNQPFLCLQWSVTA